MSPTGDDMRGKRVVVGVGGGIAAYKACGLIRLLTESGCHVDVVPTEAALRFVGSATFEALSGNPVSTGVFSDVPSVRHVALGQRRSGRGICLGLGLHAQPLIELVGNVADVKRGHRASAMLARC